MFFFFSSCVILSIDVSGRVRRKTNFISLDNSSSLLVFIITAEKNTQVHLIYSTHLARLVFTSYIHFLFFSMPPKPSKILLSKSKIPSGIVHVSMLTGIYRYALPICCPLILSTLYFDEQTHSMFLLDPFVHLF